MVHKLGSERDFHTAWDCTNHWLM